MFLATVNAIYGSSGAKGGQMGPLPPLA